MAGNTFQEVLQAGDVTRMMSIWKQIAPDQPQPRNRIEAEIMMHSARTQTSSITNSARRYSHAWLIERGLPSSLPEELKPRAQQVEQKIASAVGVAVLCQTPEMEPVARQVEKAMSDAVADCYANGDTEPAIVQARMAEARSRTIARLLGR